MVSNAAERSRRQRQESFCEPIALTRMVVNVRESRFKGMVFRVSRLMRIKEIV